MHANPGNRKEGNECIEVHSFTNSCLGAKDLHDTNPRRNIFNEVLSTGFGNYGDLHDMDIHAMVTAVSYIIYLSK